MSIATLTFDGIVAAARAALGVTDSSKGGPTDATIKLRMPMALRRFAVRAKALQTVIKLSTKANDKYLPLVDEILWPMTVSFVDSVGTSYRLDLTDQAVRPGSLGQRPTVWWLTAVNVPDVTGPSVRTIAIDPYVNINGSGNVLVEAIQLPQDIVNGTDVPEIHVAIQPYLGYFLAAELIGLFPEKAGLMPWIEGRCEEGIDVWQDLTRPGTRMPRTGKDTMGYKNRTYSRL